MLKSLQQDIIKHKVIMKFLKFSQKAGKLTLLHYFNKWKNVFEKNSFKIRVNLLKGTKEIEIQKVKIVTIPKELIKFKLILE